MSAGDKAVLAEILHATVRQIVSRVLIIAVESSQCCNTATHQINRAHVAFKQHVIAALLIGGGALFTALFCS